MSESTTSPEPVPTPFDMALRQELSRELNSMRKWFIEWEVLSPGKRASDLDVDDFDGGRIVVPAGAAFKDFVRARYWWAAEEFLMKRVHSVYERWDKDTATYPIGLRVQSLDTTEAALKRFVQSVVIFGEHVERGVWDGTSSPAFEDEGPESLTDRLDSGISRLRQGHVAVAGANSAVRGVERFFRSWPGIIGILGVLLAAIGLFVSK